MTFESETVPLFLALYQPDIPQNTGAAMRLCACLSMPLEIIEPCGFPWNESRIRRAGMDYIERVDLRRHVSWAAFLAQVRADGRRIILLTTQAQTPYTRMDYRPGDILLAGRESAGVPEDVHAQVDCEICIPMPDGVRSMNVINACAMVSGEALRQLGRM